MDDVLKDLCGNDVTSETSETDATLNGRRRVCKV